MAQAGYTPIKLYYSTTASAAPSAGNLTDGELAININDGKLYYKDNGGSVQVLAVKMPSSVLPVANGGTGLSSTPTNGQLDIGNGTGFTRAALTAGSGVSITNGAGSITISATGSGGDVVGPASATADALVAFNGTTGKLVKQAATVTVAQGGTGQTSLTSNNVILGNGTSAVQFVAPGTNGNVLTSNGTTWTSTAPAPSGVSKGQSIAFAMIFGL